MQVPYPSDSLLFANSASPYLNEMTLASPSPPAAPLHDPYFIHNPFLSNSGPNVVRNVPRIHVETELHTFAPSSPSYDQSPYGRSPQGRSPSIMLPTPNAYSSPGSSIGSAPPVTPETPYTSVSPHSPYINRPSASPLSPSHLSVHPAAFDHKVRFPCSYV